MFDLTVCIAIVNMRLALLQYRPLDDLFKVQLPLNVLVALNY